MRWLCVPRTKVVGERKFPEEETAGKRQKRWANKEFLWVDWKSCSRHLGIGQSWEKMGGRDLERKMTLKFAATVTGRLMMTLLDKGTSGRRANFARMINSVEETQSDIRKNFLTLRNVRQ